MAIIRWNPWNLERFFEDDWDIPTIPGISRLGQGLNIYDTEEAVVAEVALPGVTEDKIDVSVDNRVVRISGSSEVKEEEKAKRRYFMSSLVSSFNYSFRLPEGVVEDKEPEAELENGVLKLTFAKMKKTPPKKVLVKAKSKAVK